MSHPRTKSRHAIRLAGGAALVAALLATLAGCGAGSSSADGAPRSGRVRPRSIVLISIDTLRADHLGSYGYALPTSPKLDAFAARSVVFRNCLSASGHTLASHKAMLSGRYPAAFLDAYSKQGGPPAPTSGSLAYYQLALRGWVSPPLSARLKQAGIATLGFTDGGFLQPQFGFGEGFDEYRSARAGIARHLSNAEDWLVGNPARPFFLFLHGYDVHCPYAAPERYLKKFETVCTGRLRFDGTCGKDYFNTLDLTAEEKLHVARHYDAGILHADDEVGKFLDFLESAGRFADTIIIITSDHGESLGEREFVGHGELYDNQLRVPLLIYAPGIAPGVVTAPVCGIDVAPTILDLVTGKVPDGLDGWSLRGLLESAGKPAPAAAAATAALHRAPDFDARPRFASITVNEGRGYATRLRKAAAEDAGAFKLIADLESGEKQLYDLRRDPAETKNLAGTGRPEETRLLETIRARDPGKLRGYDPSASGKTPGDETMTPEMLEELRSLGYVK